MSGATRPRILPPPPRRRDWWMAGLAAGALLGASEIALAGRLGPAPPERLAMVLGAGTALLVALPCGAIGLALRIARWRPPHSALVGGTLGPLLAAPILGDVIAAWMSGALPSPRTLLALVLAFAAGGVAARLGARLEAGGLPLPGVSLLAVASLLVASGETAERLLEAVTPARLGIAALVAIVIAVLATALAVRGGRHDAVSPARWFVSALGALVLVVAAAFAPRALPWLLFDSALTEIAPGPPHLLMVDLGALRGGEPAPVGIELLASEGMPCTLDAERDAGASAALGAGSVLAELARRGYAAAAIVRDPARAEALPPALRNARPGSGDWLAQYGARTSAGPALLAMGPAALRALGLGARLRSPRDVASDARGWLVGWRANHAHAPFALLVDFSDSRRLTAEDAADGAIVSLRNLLRELDVDSRTVVLAAIVRRDEAGARVEAALAPPVVEGFAFDASDSPTRVSRDVLIAALTALPDASATSPPRLPGVRWRPVRAP